MTKEFPTIDESYEIKDSSETEARLAAEKAEGRIRKISEHFSPEVVANLVESNIVLTLGDVRGHTDFVVYDPTPKFLGEIAKLNDTLGDHGIRFSKPKKFTNQSGESGVYVVVESMEGYAKNTKASHIPGIEPLDITKGWNDLKKQGRKMMESLKEARARGDLSKELSDVSLDTIFVGVIKGYPDQAILDVADAVAHKRYNQTVSSNLAGVSLYGGAQPNYAYYPEHAKNPKIAAHQKYWENILKKFYDSRWHTLIMNDKKFKEARTQMEENDKERAVKRKKKIATQRSSAKVGSPAQQFRN